MKNRICALIKNLETKNLILIAFPHLLIILLLAIYYLVTLQFSKSTMALRAIWWNMIRLTKTVRERRRVQRSRVISDNELFSRVGKKINWHEMFIHFKKIEANF